MNSLGGAALSEALGNRKMLGVASKSLKIRNQIQNEILWLSSLYASSDK